MVNKLWSFLQTRTNVILLKYQDINRHSCQPDNYFTNGYRGVCNIRSFSKFQSVCSRDANLLEVLGVRLMSIDGNHMHQWISPCIKLNYIHNTTAPIVILGKLCNTVHLHMGCKRHVLNCTIV